jgi:hypothetical protein
MKIVEIDPAIEADPGLLGAIRSGHELFEARFGRDSSTVSAAWAMLHDDRGRPLVRLDLSDSGDAEHRVYHLQDVDDPRRVLSRLVSAWGDLLQVQSHKLLEGMQAAATASGGS